MTATENGPRLCVAAARTHWMPQIVTTLESKGLAVHDPSWQKFERHDESLTQRTARESSQDSPVGHSAQAQLPPAITERL